MCLALLRRRDGTRSHRQGCGGLSASPSVGHGHSLGRRTMDHMDHGLPPSSGEAPPSPASQDATGQRGPTCVAYQPTQTRLPVQATSKKILILHRDVFPACFSISRPLQPPSAQCSTSRGGDMPCSRWHDSFTGGAEATPRKGTLSCRQRDTATATDVQRPSSLPGLKKRQQRVGKQQSACSSVL